MFYFQDLLSKRDSGFGLVWLAATLGPKSSFKKLPRRSVVSADISQLCHLISQPAEPLALRLSSNLMVGVVRVYKIKHEIFMSDVNNCFVSLKKTIQDLQSFSDASAAQFQMGHSTMGLDALTLSEDPTLVAAFDLGNFDLNWNDISFSKPREIRHNADEDNLDDEDYSEQTRKSTRAKQSIDRFRSAPHTLEENYDHLLSSSMNGSNHAAFLNLSSSQAGDFDFNSLEVDNNLFERGNELGLDIIQSVGEDLARELGEGWCLETQDVTPDSWVEPDNVYTSAAYGNDEVVAPIEHNFMALEKAYSEPNMVGLVLVSPVSNQREQSVLQTFPAGTVVIPDSNQSLVGFPKQNALVERPYKPLVDDEANLLTDPLATKQPKRARVLFDPRIELTDEELKAARDTYVEGQTIQKLHKEWRRFAKESGRTMEELICGVPRGLEFPILAEFWLSVCGDQIRVRPGEDINAPKRRRLSDNDKAVPNALHEKYSQTDGAYQDDRMDIENGPGMQETDDYCAEHFDQELEMEVRRMRSSEEVEQGRYAAIRSTPLSGSVFNIDVSPLQQRDSFSQRTTLYPWDNAAGSSSVDEVPNGVLGIGSDAMSVGEADFDLGNLSANSQNELRSIDGRLFTMASANAMDVQFGSGQLNHTDEDEFRFEVGDEDPQVAKNDEAISLGLNRDLLNFLEYCKMQLKTLRGIQDSMLFEDIIPPSSSTPRIAAAAFYHCLALTTKSLLKVHQSSGYGPIDIRLH